jgi:hypothetical protein
MRLPAYGRDLVNLQRTGRNVQWLVISLSFDLGKPLPRVVVTDDTDITNLDLRFVAGLDCLIAHENKTKRALDVAELALRCGATVCVTHDQETDETLTTEQVKAIRGMQ